MDGYRVWDTTRTISKSWFFYFFRRNSMVSLANGTSSRGESYEVTPVNNWKQLWMKVKGKTVRLRSRFTWVHRARVDRTRVLLWSRERLSVDQSILLPFYSFSLLINWILPGSNSIRRRARGVEKKLCGFNVGPNDDHSWTHNYQKNHLRHPNTWKPL